ncbi:MAG: hypothetical protein MUE36_05235 [Acidimicrobiales bacterium]|jgi:hypothetical protein|nr:hypothetical protein [Acidimicrobiales bacterium]
MRSVLVFLLAFLATWIVLVSLAVLALRWRLQRRNRVSPAVKSPAPLHWLYSPSQTARLHRRLQGAVADIHLAPAHRRRSRPTTESSVDELRRELEYQAVELDYHLVIAARHPRSQRRPLVASLDSQVAQVELLSARLSRLSRPAGVAPSGWDAAQQPPEVLARLSQQLDLLDAASNELAEIERAAGLVDVDALLGRVSDDGPVEIGRPGPPAAPRAVPPPA